MSEVFGIVNGWEVKGREDGGYGVYDDHGLVSGPHGSKVEAIGAALKLPRLSALNVFPSGRRDGLATLEMAADQD